MPGLMAQTDTLFWFAVPEVASTHADRPVYLRLSTLNQPSIVTLSVPADLTFKPVIVNISLNSSQTIDLTPFLDVIENRPGNIILNKGLRIQATNSITAYYEVYTSCQCNPEIFALKGQNALGTEFYTPFQNSLDNRADAISSFDIVATENNTRITITPSNDIVGHGANNPFTIVLNKGQTFSAVAVSIIAASHLGGSHIVSDKPIAVTVKDDSLVLSTCQDLVGDQIVPIINIGKKYIVVKGFLYTDDKVFVMAVEDNTELFFDGSITSIATINHAETFAYDLSKSTLFIESSKPVYVTHLSGFGCELGMPLLPSIACTGSSQIGFTRSSDEFFGLILLTKKQNQSYFSINGSNTLVQPGLFAAVPGTNDDWVYATISFSTAQIASGSGNIISNSNGVFHLGLIIGRETGGCRYGYFSAFNTYSPTIQSDHYCLSSGTDFSISDTSGLQSVTWNFNDTLSGQGNYSDISHPVHVFSQAGKYQVSAIVQHDCGIDSLVCPVTIKPSPAIELGNDTTLCSGNSIELSPGKLFRNYRWNTGDTLPAIKPSNAGTYSVMVTDANGCTNADTIRIDSSTNPSIISVDTLIRGQITIYATNGTEPFQYSLNGSDYRTSNIFSNLQPDLYVVTVKDANNCLVFETVNLYDYLLQIPNFFTPNDDGIHDTWEIKGMEAFPDALIQLFDRFGKVLVSYKGTDTGWNGYCNGKPVKSDDYWYFITIPGKPVYKGHVTLKR